MENKEIAERIKQARKERKFTQKKVANYLGKKSSNAISEIERGNVNVTAEDIVKLSDLLNKPIMYFFGQDYPDDYTSDIFAILEQLTPDEIEDLKMLAQSNSEQKALINELTGNPDLQENREFILEYRRVLNEKLIPLSKLITNIVNTRNQLEELVGIKEYPEENS